MTETDVPDDALTVPDLLAEELHGEPVTYRQLDYWIGAGLIYADEPHPGSGRDRLVPRSEVPVIRALARLTLGGLALRAAAPLARQLATGVTTVRFAGYDVVFVGAASSDDTEPEAPRDRDELLGDLQGIVTHIQGRVASAHRNRTSRSAGRITAFEEIQRLIEEVIGRRG